MNRDLGNGLILRSISDAHSSDRRDLPAFYTEVFSEANDESDPWIAPWAETLLSGDHPTVTADDIWTVVDTTQNDRIVSALLLIPQTWRYEWIELPVGRIEIVATHKDYRRRGLVRALMQTAHERSAALGHTVQAITGIPHYYRQFGYAMAVDLGAYATIPLASVRPLDADKTPDYTLRAATPADIPTLVAWDQHEGDQALLTTVRSESDWAYEWGRPAEHIWKMDVLIITDTDGQGVGYLAIQQKLDAGPNGWLACHAYVVGDKASHLATYKDVVHGLKTYLENRYADDPPHFLHFAAGMNEGFMTLTKSSYPAVTREHTYAWYLRIADLPRFVQQIAPVLEKRLEHSAAHRFTGELKINFYDSTGLRIAFEQGRVSAAEIILMDTPQTTDKADVHLPWHMLLALIFGYRTFEELEFVLPECRANGKARVLFQVLFPRKRSWIRPFA